jgi:hypothetical protein
VTNSGQQQYGPPPQQPGQPQYGAPPQYGQPQYGRPQYGRPQQGQAQYGQAQYGQAQYGQPQQGRPQYGQPQQQWAAPAQPFPQPSEQQPYGQQVPWGVAPPQQQFDQRAQARKSAVKQMAIGGVVAVVGLIITIVTYRAASDGGHYVVAWGPALFGLIAFVRGLVAYTRA